MSSKENLAIDSDLTRLDVLAQVTPGLVIVVDHIMGVWKLEESSSWNAAVRKMTFMVSQWKSPPAQRDVFFDAITQTVNRLIQWCGMMLDKSVVERACDQKSIFSKLIVETKLNNEEKEKMVEILVVLERVCRRLIFALKGIHVLETSRPYNHDTTFASRLHVEVTEPVCQFLTRIQRKVGLDYYSLIFQPETLKVIKENTSAMRSLSSLLTPLEPFVQPKHSASDPAIIAENGSNDSNINLTSDKKKAGNNNKTIVSPISPTNTDQDDNKSIPKNLFIAATQPTDAVQDMNAAVDIFAENNANTSPQKQASNNIILGTNEKNVVSYQRKQKE